MIAKLLTAREIAPHLRMHWQTILKYKRQGKISAEIDLPNKVLFDLRKVKKQLVAETTKRDRARFNGMIPTL